MEKIYNTLKDFSYLIFIYLGMKTDVVKILFFLMVIDTVFGILKAIRLKYKISFSVLLWGIVTKMSLLGIPMIIALLAKALSFDFYYFVVAVMNIIVVSEGLSIITNFMSIRTKTEVKNEDYITLLLKGIKDGLHKLVMKLLAVLKDGGKNDINT